MLQNLSCKYLRLGSGNNQRFAAVFKLFQHWRNSVVNFVFKDALFAEILPVKCDGMFRFLFRKTVILFKRIAQRRSDKRIQLCFVSNFNAVFLQRIGNRVGDTDTGIGQGAVQVKQNNLIVFHYRFPSFSQIAPKSDACMISAFCNHYKTLSEETQRIVKIYKIFTAVHRKRM